MLVRRNRLDNISISLVFTILGGILGYATFYMNSKKNTKQETKEEVSIMTKLDTKLSLISKNVDVCSYKAHLLFLESQTLEMFSVEKAKTLMIFINHFTL